MRQLITNDVFKMSRILKKIELKGINGGSDEELGVAILIKAAENLFLAQDEVNEFLGDLCGMTGKEFGELPLTQSAELIQEFKKLDGVKLFFERAARLMNAGQQT